MYYIVYFSTLLNLIFSTFIDTVFKFLEDNREVLEQVDERGVVPEEILIKLKVLVMNKSRMKTRLDIFSFHYTILSV